MNVTRYSPISLNIELSKEEAMVCIVLLEMKKNARYVGGWGKSALAKLLKSLGMKSLEGALK